MVALIDNSIYSGKPTSQVVFLYIHLESNKKSRSPTIKWKILHANIVNDGERKYVEAFEIQKHSGDLMNGCTGRTISV